MPNLNWVHQTFRITDIVDLSNYIFRLEEYILEGDGNITCHALGKKAFVDSNFACIFFQLPFFLESYGFSYITLSLIIPIILISIFGNIKQNYRWFILNQCLWDALIAYNFICDKPSLNEWFKEMYTAEWYAQNRKDDKNWFLPINQGPSTCFYSFQFQANEYINPFLYILNQIFSLSSKNSAYAPLLLLTFSRFVCLYFHYFYDKFVTAKKITFIIIGFNVFCLLLINSNTIYKVIAKPYLAENRLNCITLCNETDFSNAKEITYKGCLNNCDIGYYYYMNIPYFKIFLWAFPPILLILANIFALLLIAKIVRQFKYQIKHNRTNFLSSVKIAVIILFQCLTMTFLFFISLEKGYSSFLIDFYKFNITSVMDTWPSWVRFLVLDSTVQCLNLLRIFLDALIILLVLTEYRKAWIGFLYFCGLILLRPKVAFNKLKKSNENDSGKIFRISNSAQNNRVKHSKTLSTITV